MPLGAGMDALRLELDATRKALDRLTRDHADALLRYEEKRDEQARLRETLERRAERAERDEALTLGPIHDDAEVRENEEARKVIQAIAAQTSESEADTVQAFLGAYTRGRADERAEVCAEVERAIRLYGQMSGTSDEVGALSALLDDLAMGTHITGAKNEGRGGW